MNWNPNPVVWSFPLKIERENLLKLPLTEELKQVISKQPVLKKNQLVELQNSIKDKRLFLLIKTALESI